MKYLKILGLIAIASAVLTTSATATVLTSPAGTEYTGTVHETGTGSWIISLGFAEVTCTQFTGVWTDSTNTTTASGNWTQTSWSNCGSVTVDTLSRGSVRVASGGAVTAVGSEVTFSALGTSCVYGGGTGTSLGTLTGGTTAKMTVSAQLPKISGGFLCANPAKMTGTASVSTPDTLLVD